MNGASDPAYPTTWLEIDQKEIDAMEDNYHIVAHPGDCDTCYAKDNTDPVTKEPVDPRTQKPGDEQIIPGFKHYYKYKLKISESCYCCK